VKIFNLHGDEWDRSEEREGWRMRDASVSRRIAPSSSALSTLLMPEIVEYLDTGKVGTRNAAGERLFLSRPGPTVGYWEGED